MVRIGALSSWTLLPFVLAWKITPDDVVKHRLEGQQLQLVSCKSQPKEREKKKGEKRVALLLTCN